jgi:hypothetical protein
MLALHQLFGFFLAGSLLVAQGYATASFLKHFAYGFTMAMQGTQVEPTPALRGFVLAEVNKGLPYHFVLERVLNRF